MAEKTIWFEGRLIPASEARVSVFDHGLLYGDGIFEGIRAYHGRVLKMRTHLQRLQHSARHIRLEIPYTSEQLADAIREVLAANDLRDGYLRLCVTRGVGTLGLNPYLCDNPTVFIIADSIALYPREFYEKGLNVVTASTIRNHPAALSPRVKSMNYLNNILAKIEAIEGGGAEAVMLNHLGHVAECTGDNLFIVHQRHGFPTVVTPPPHAGILEGVTRNLVIELAQEADLPVEEADLTRHDLFAADEMFLTGTAAEVIPVTRLDGRLIGDGVPGPITLQLTEAFRKLMKNAPQD